MRNSGGLFVRISCRRLCVRTSLERVEVQAPADFSTWNIGLCRSTKLICATEKGRYSDKICFEPSVRNY